MVQPKLNPSHRVYLLRLWQERECGAWRVSLQEAGNTEHRLFPDLERLMAFLMWVTAEAADLPTPADDMPSSLPDEMS